MRSFQTGMNQSSLAGMSSRAFDVMHFFRHSGESSQWIRRIIDGVFKDLRFEEKSQH
ncbi:hypothetical protein [Comamonas fluminis]|uniref:hypothetical protein n=1 Tax=Comamonas fluminis TaxID=2796366 RepID=UPI001C4464F2|nr:hypothetical protein [Comamonas fluminis]